jgi:hypothetical protein
MKRMLFLFWGLPAFVFIGCGNKSDTPASQIKDYPVSMTGLDSLKLGMSKAELEKMLDTTFKLRHITVDGGAYDTFPTRYKGMDIVVFLQESDETKVAALSGIRSDNPSCKTLHGIGVGSAKAAVIEAYADYKRYIAPEYEIYPERSKTKSVIAVMDTADSRAMLFHIMNKKVTSIEVCSYYEFY